MPPRRIRQKFITSKGFTAPVSRSSANANQVIIEELNIQFREIQLDLASGSITDRQAAIKYLELADMAASAGLEYKSLGYRIQSQNLINKSEKADTAAGKKASAAAQKISEEELVTLVNDVEEQIAEEFGKVERGASPVDVFDAVTFLIINQRQAIMEANIDDDLRSDLINYFDGTKEWKGIGNSTSFNKSTLGSSLREFMGVESGNIYEDWWNAFDTINMDRDVVDEDGDSIWVWEQIVEEGKTGLNRGNQRWVIADSSEPEFINTSLFAIEKVNEETGKRFNNVYYYSNVLIDEDELGNQTFGFIDNGTNQIFQSISEENLNDVAFGRSDLNEFTIPFGTPPPLTLEQIKQQKATQEKISKISAGFQEETNLFLGEEVRQDTARQTVAPPPRMSVEPTSAEAARQSNPLGLPGTFEASGLKAFKDKFFPR